MGFLHTGGIDTVGIGGIFLQRFKSFGLTHVVELEVQPAFLAEVGIRDGIIQMAVDHHHSTVVGGIATIKAVFRKHDRAPRVVSVIGGDARVVHLEASGEHPRAIGRVEAVVVAQILIPAHHLITLLGFLGILLGLGPVLLL